MSINIMCNNYSRNYGLLTVSLSRCVRVLWISVIMFHQTTFTTAVLPSPPVELIASDITPSSLKLSWKPAGNPEEIYYFVVQYKMKDDPGEFRNTIRIEGTEVTVKKLQPFRQYEFWVSAETKVSRSLPSASIEVITGEEAPGSPPRNVKARSQNQHTIMIEWDEPEIPNGVIQGYNVFYTTDPALPIVLWDSEIHRDKRVATIHHLDPDRTYTISVLAFSRMGRGPLSQPVQVNTRQGVPLQPRNLKAVAVSPTEVEISWNPPEDMEKITSYTLYYHDLSQHQNGKIILNAPATRYTLSELIPDTIYHIQLAGRSALGEGAKTVLVQVKTPEFKPPTPENVQAVWTSSRTIQVTWDEPSQEHLIAMYRVYYCSFLLEDMSLWEFKDTDGPTTVVTISVEESTSYAIKVKAKSVDERWSALTDVILIDVMPPGTAPRNVKARSQNQHTIVIEWDEPEIPNGVIQGYKVFYTTEPALPIVLWDSEIYSDKRMATITNLDPDRTYTISVLAFSLMGQGPLSQPVQVFTRQGVPLQPRDLKAVAISPTEVEISWNPPEDMEKITSYTLYYYDLSQHQNGKIILNPPATRYTLSELIPNTIYHIQLAGRSALGEGAKTVLVQVKTQEFIPGEPKKVQVQPVNSTTIYVKWRPPKANNQNGIIRGYYAYYVEVNDNKELKLNTERMQETSDGNQNEMVIVGLKPDTRYSLTVAGYTRKGDGVRSKPKIVTTKGAVPSSPRDLVAEFIQQEPPIVQVTWQKPEHIHGELLGYKLYWGSIGKVYQQILLKPNQQSYITNILDRGVRYEFRVLAMNEIDYGDRAVVTIDIPEGKPPTPENVRAVRTSSRTIQVTWDEPSQEHLMAMYRVYYCSFLVEDMSLWDYEDTDGPTTAVTISVEELTSYAIKVKAKSVEDRWSDLSDVIITDFLPPKPPTPENVQAVRTSSRSIQVTWDEPSQENLIAMYRVCYCSFLVEDMSLWDYKDTDGPTTVVTISVEELTSYAIKVKAKSVDGRWSDVTDVILTDVMPPKHRGAVQNSQTSGRGSRKLTASGERPEKKKKNVVRCSLISCIRYYTNI